MSKKRGKKECLSLTCDYPRFITITYCDSSPNTRWGRRKAVSGLQLHDKLFMVDGHYISLKGTKRANTVRITRVHYGVPDWAGEKLKAKFNAAVDKINSVKDIVSTKLPSIRTDVVID